MGTNDNRQSLEPGSTSSNKDSVSRRLGIPIDNAIGLRLVIIEDEQATRKILSRITPRDSTRVRHRRTAELPTGTGAAA